MLFKHTFCSKNSALSSWSHWLKTTTYIHIYIVLCGLLQITHNSYLVNLRSNICKSCCLNIHFVQKKGLFIWNYHKCLSQLFLIHLNTYGMGLRPLEIFLLLHCTVREKGWCKFVLIVWREMLCDALFSCFAAVIITRQWWPIQVLWIKYFVSMRALINFFKRDKMVVFFPYIIYSTYSKLIAPLSINQSKKLL